MDGLAWHGEGDFSLLRSYLDLGTHVFDHHHHVAHQEAPL